MPVMVETTVSRRPRPVPIHFSHAEQSFFLKKRCAPISTSSTSSSTCSSPARLSLSLPPRPPSKECPSLSRVFPQEASPWSPLSFSLVKSPPPNSVYDPSKQQSYFSQCFTNLGLLGRGSFGEVYKVKKKKTHISYLIFHHKAESKIIILSTLNCMFRITIDTRLWNHPHLVWNDEVYSLYNIFAIKSRSVAAFLFFPGAKQQGWPPICCQIFCTML